MNLQYYNSESFKNDFIFPKELYSLINYRISYDLKEYKLVILDDNRLLINSETLDWAFHTRLKKGYWNKKTLGSTFELFSINDSSVQSFLSLNWFSNLLKEELNESLDQKILLEDSFSNRSMMINQILNISRPIDVLNEGSKYLKKDYWFSKPVFENLNSTKFFQFV